MGDCGKLPWSWWYMMTMTPCLWSCGERNLSVFAAPLHAEKMIKRDETWMFHLQGLCFCISGSLPNRQSNSFSRQTVSCGCARSMPSISNDDPGASWHSTPKITFLLVSKDAPKNEWSYHICISYLLLAPLRHSFRCKSAQTLKQVEENPSSWLPWTVSFRPAQGWSVPTFLHIVRLPQENVFIWKTWVSLGNSGVDNLKKTFFYGVLWPHGSRIRAISVFFAEGKWQERFPSSVFQLQSAPKKSDLTDVHPCLQTQCCYQL